MIGALAIPGFLVGVVFAMVLRIAEGQRGVAELSLARLATWGAVIDELRSPVVHDGLLLDHHELLGHELGAKLQAREVNTRP